MVAPALEAALAAFAYESVRGELPSPAEVAGHEFDRKAEEIREEAV